MKKVAIIGATSGIGRELAIRYATHSYLVAVSGRRRNLLDALQQLHPDNIKTECFDVTGKENIVHLRSMIDQLGGLDILVYNAGYGEVSKSLDWDIDKRTVDTNINGFIEIVNYGFNYFVNQGFGQIAITSSVAAERGNSSAPAYSASKAFASIYAEGLSLKARRLKHDITVTDIRPGFVNTKMAKGDRRFWVAPVGKAADQIFAAITKKKRRTYITGRWRIAAWLMRQMPYGIYKRFA